MRAVQVFWVDAGSRHGWEKITDIHEWMQDDSHFTVDTIGLLVAESENYICLAMGSSTDSVLNAVRINKNSIIRFEELGYVEDFGPTVGNEGQE